MHAPRLLLLETSHQPGFVALGKGDALRAVKLEEARRHARDLAPAVGELLAWQGCTPRDVDAVVVSRGPGSYTGLRVGNISAKVFAYATGCALLGLETFAVIAAQAPPDGKRLAVIADAQQDKIYVREFEGILPVTALRIQPFGEWLDAAAKPLAVSGPGLHKWARHLPAGMEPLEPELWNPLPATMWQLGLARHGRGERDDVWGMEPIYLRPSAAEEQWAKRGQA